MDLHENLVIVELEYRHTTLSLMFRHRGVIYKTFWKCVTEGKFVIPRSPVCIS